MQEKEGIIMIYLQWQCDKQIALLLGMCQERFHVSAPSSDSAWVKVRDITLKNSDKAIIEQGLELTDLHINCAQRLSQGQFPKLNGLKISLVQSEALKGLTANAIQIFT